MKFLDVLLVSLIGGAGLTTLMALLTAVGYIIHLLAGGEF